MIRVQINLMEKYRMIKKKNFDKVHTRNLKINMGNDSYAFISNQCALIDTGIFSL